MVKFLDAAKEGLGEHHSFVMNDVIRLYCQQEVQQFAAGAKFSPSRSKVVILKRGLPGPGWEWARASDTSGSSQEEREDQSEEAVRRSGTSSSAKNCFTQTDLQGHPDRIQPPCCGSLSHHDELIYMNI